MVLIRGRDLARAQLIRRAHDAKYHGGRRTAREEPDEKSGLWKVVCPVCQPERAEEARDG